MKIKYPILVLLPVILAGACAPVVAPSEAAPTPIRLTESSPQPELPIVSSWKAVRDQRYGFGLAVPCWWLVDPIPEEGFGGAMTIKNYDEAFFNANSTKGFWDWPYGSLKLDVIIMEGVDPSKSDADAYMDFVDPTMSGLVSAEVQQFGNHQSTVITLSNLVNTNDMDVKLFIYRLAPDRILMIAPTPQSIIETPDFHALLSSIVLTPEEQIALPIITPAPALIDASCAG